MTAQYSTRALATRSPATAPNARLHAAKRPALAGRVKTGTLCALLGLAGSTFVAPAEASAAPFDVGPFAPGSVVVTQGGTIFGGTNTGTGVELNGASGLLTVGAAVVTHLPTIFVANYDGSTVTSYALAGGGNAAPRVTLGYPVTSPQGLAFDRSGDLWVANTGSVVEYPKSQLTKASPEPGVVINSGGDAMAGLAFDSSGDLWVDDYGSAIIVEYAKSELTKSGYLTPKVTISSSELSMPFGLAFDRSGDLWVGDEGACGRSSACASGNVFEYTKGELVKSGSPAPKAELSLVGAAATVFDSSGDLWVATGYGGSVVEYTKNQLAQSPLSPTVTITSAHFEEPDGIAFDSSGDLWVADYGASTVSEFTKAQLRTSGSPTPRITFSNGVQGPVALAIEP